MIPLYLNVGAVVTAGVAAAQVPIPNIGLPTGEQEGPRISWDITRDLTPEPDHGEIKVWNLDPTAALAMRSAWELALPGLYKVSLSFGWDAKVLLWAVLDPYAITPSIPDGPVDIVTRFEVGDGGIGLRDGVVGMSLAAGDFSQMIQILAVGLKAGIDPASLAVFQAAAASAPVQLFDNLSLYGDPRSIFTDLMESLDLQWWIQNSTIIIVPSGTPLAGPPAIVTPETGLLTYSPNADGSISLTMLADPAIAQGQAIIVLDEFKAPIAEGVYRAYSVRCVGDTNTGATMEIHAKKTLTGIGL